MKKISLFLTALTLFCAVLAFGSENMVKVHGRVTDLHGNPLAGADIYFGDYVDTIENGKLVRNKMKKNFPAVTDKNPNALEKVKRGSSKDFIEVMKKKRRSLGLPNEESPVQSLADAKTNSPDH